MVDNKFIGIVIAIGGLAGALLSGFADYLSLGITQDDPSFVEFGWVQGLGVAAGLIILIIGIVIVFYFYRKKEELEEEDEDEEEEEFVCPTCGAAVEANSAECGE